MCFSLAWIAALLVWIIVICAAYGLVQLLVGFILPKLGIGGEIISFIVRAFYIIFWAIVCILAVYFIVDLIECLSPSLSMPRLR